MIIYLRNISIIHLILIYRELTVYIYIYIYIYIAYHIFNNINKCKHKTLNAPVYNDSDPCHNDRYHIIVYRYTIYIQAVMMH